VRYEVVSDRLQTGGPHAHADRNGLHR
jgi:hypothetical protein